MPILLLLIMFRMLPAWCSSMVIRAFGSSRNIWSALDAA